MIVVVGWLMRRGVTDAVEGGVGGVVHSILGAEALHVAVSHTEGEVGIGEEVTVGILLHHASHISTHQTADFAFVGVVDGFAPV